MTIHKIISSVEYNLLLNQTKLLKSPKVFKPTNKNDILKLWGQQPNVASLPVENGLSRKNEDHHIHIHKVTG